MTIAVVLPPFPSPTPEFMPFPDKTLSQTGVPRLHRGQVSTVLIMRPWDPPARPGRETLGAPGAPFPPPSGTHSSTGRRRPRGQRAAGPGTCWSLCGPSVQDGGTRNQESGGVGDRLLDSQRYAPAWSAGLALGDSSPCPPGAPCKALGTLEMVTALPVGAGGFHVMLGR